MGDKLHNAQECYFLVNREQFKQELVAEIQKQNAKQDKLTDEFQKEITKRIDDLEKEVRSGFKELNNGWKKDLIDQLVASLTGYKSKKQQIWLETIKVLGILAGSGGIIWLLVTKIGGAA